MYNMFLDDIRNPQDVTWVDNFPRNIGWVVVRTYNEAVAMCKMRGYPLRVSFDHDLGYEESNMHKSGIIVVTNATEEKSGLDFAKWLIEYDMDTGNMPPDFSFTVHSMNPIGTKNIQSLLDNYLRHKRKI